MKAEVNNYNICLSLLGGDTDHDDGDHTIEDLSRHWCVGLDVQQRQETSIVGIISNNKMVTFIVPPRDVTLSRGCKTESPADQKLTYVCSKQRQRYQQGQRYREVFS